MTQNPIEIEGTPERAKDRGDTTGLGFFAKPLGDSPYLGSPDVVDSIVRAFCQDALNLRIAVGYGEISQDAFMTKLNALADRNASIFTHPSAPYRFMPFNSVDGVGEFVKAALGMSDPADVAVHTMFMNTANQIFAAHALHLSGTATDDDVQFQIGAAVEDATRMLLGLPQADA